MGLGALRVHLRALEVGLGALGVDRRVLGLGLGALGADLRALGVDRGVPGMDLRALGADLGVPGMDLGVLRVDLGAPGVDLGAGSRGSGRVPTGFRWTEERNESSSHTNILRLLRLARLVKLVRFCRELFLLVQGIFGAVRLLLWIFVLLFLVFFAVGVFLTKSIGHKEEDEYAPELRDPWILYWFSTVARSMSTLFQVMLLEDWPEISKSTSAKYPGMNVFFMGYILLANIILVNLMTGVIVESVLQIVKEDAVEKAKLAEKRKRALLRQLEIYFRNADVDGSGELDQMEFEELIFTPHVSRHLRNLDVSEREAQTLFDVLDRDESKTITIEEFIQGIVNSQGNLTPRHLMSVQYDLHRCISASTLSFDEA